MRCSTNIRLDSLDSLATALNQYCDERYIRYNSQEREHVAKLLVILHVRRGLHRVDQLKAALREMIVDEG
jgi:hypothetical protein